MKLFSFLTGVAFTLSAISAQAQQYTVPEGVMSFSFPPGVTTYASFPLTADPVYGDAVSAVTATTISVVNASAFTGSLANLNAMGAPYFVIFTGGAQVGRVLKISSNTATTLTLNTTDGGVGTPEPLTGNTDSTAFAVGTPATSQLFNVAVGDTFEVYPGETIASIFGTGTAPILTGSTTFKNADFITFPKSGTAPGVIYYFNTNTQHWARADDNSSSPANEDNTVVYPFASVAVFVREANKSASLVMQGRVADTNLLVKSIGNSETFTANPYASETTLGALGLTFGPNFAISNTFKLADSVGVFDSAANPPGFDIYYEDANSVWRRYPDTSTSYNNYSIPAGSVITINQRKPVTGATSFLPTEMPYSLDQ